MRAPVLFYGHLHSNHPFPYLPKDFSPRDCFTSYLPFFTPTPVSSISLHFESFTYLPTFLQISSTYLPSHLFYLLSFRSLLPTFHHISFSYLPSHLFTYLPSHLFTYLPLHFVLYYYCLQHIVCHRFPLLSIFSCSYYV